MPSSNYKVLLYNLLKTFPVSGRRMRCLFYWAINLLNPPTAAMGSKKTATVKRWTGKSAKLPPPNSFKAIPWSKQKARVKQKEEKDERLIANFNTILAAILKNPSLWKEQEFQPIRDFINATITSNPQIYPHALPDGVEKKSWMAHLSTLCLRKGSRKKFYARETISNSEKIVVFTAIAHKFGDVNIPKRTMATMHATIKRYHCNWWRQWIFDAESQY